MKIIRANLKSTLEPFYAIEENGQYILIENPFACGEIRGSETKYNEEEITLLAPCVPTKVVCVGLNYHDHAQEMKIELPKEPLIFLKPPSSVIGPGASIVHPWQSKQVDYEAELAIVVGKEAKDVPAEKAEEYIFGYTCLNDVTARDLQKIDGQWTRAKGFDTFCPIGPWIETEFDWRDKALSARVNGKVRQSGRTSDLIFDIPQILSYVSGIMTLVPGDIIATGTPGGIGQMLIGDFVEIEVEGIGILKNYMAAKS